VGNWASREDDLDGVGGSDFEENNSAIGTHFNSSG